MSIFKIKAIIRRKKFKYINCQAMNIGRIEPNIPNRDFSITKTDEKWVTDITYLYYRKSFKKSYLSALMGLHNNEILSYKLSTSLNREFVESMLNEAFPKEKGLDLSSLIIHSNPGAIIDRTLIKYYTKYV